MRRSPLGVVAWSVGNLLLILLVSYAISIVFTLTTEEGARPLTRSEVLISSFWFVMVVILLGAVLYLAVLWVVLRARRPAHPRSVALWTSPLVPLAVWFTMFGSDGGLVTLLFAAVLSVASGLVVRLPHPPDAVRVGP